MVVKGSVCCVSDGDACLTRDGGGNEEDVVVVAEWIC